MPRVSNELEGQYYEPICIGPIAQADVSASTTIGTLPASIVASGSYVSAVIPTDGYRVIAVGVTSTQAGVLSVQRYLDLAGLVAQGAPLTASILAATPVVLNATDYAPCQSFRITITNTNAGAAAAITNFACLLNAQ
jgi:hypothetical protein